MVVHSRSIGYLLNSLTDLEAIRVRTARLAALHQVVSAALPQELAQHIRVGYETQGTVVLLADSGAAAAKGRHLVPRVLLTIKQRIGEVKAIRIEVQLVRRRRADARPIRRIGATGVANLTKLATSLPDGPLRAALGRLIGHQRSDGDDQPLEDQERCYHEGDSEDRTEQTPSPDQPPAVSGDDIQAEAAGDQQQNDEADRA